MLEGSLVNSIFLRGLLILWFVCYIMEIYKFGYFEEFLGLRDGIFYSVIVG